MRAAAAGALLLSLVGCVPNYVVPEPLYRQVDQGVSFSQLRQDAGRYKGVSVMLGGAVLNAKLLPEGTEIEVLQLALDDSDRPAGASELSEGRFLVIDPERRDPAVLQRRLITVVGEVVGMKTRAVDEVEYGFPYLSARFIHVWRGANDYPAGAAYPYYYPYSEPYPYPYAPYYPYFYGDPFFWSAPFSYYGYGYYGASGGPAHPGPSQRRFEAPPGGQPAPSSPSLPPPSSPSPGGGSGRRFR